MGGGLIQLIAYGAQDVYLTGNPQITFWKIVYRRCTNFSMESIEQTFSGVADFGSKVECNIARKGDLIGKMYLVADLPALAVQVSGSAAGTTSGTVRLTFNYTNLTAGMQSRSGTNNQPDYSAAWTEHVGHALIDEVTVSIGGQEIDKHYGLWLEIWNDLTQTAEKEYGYDKMVGEAKREELPFNAVEKRTLHIPLQFWFNRNPGLAIPLIALQYHDVNISLKLRDFDSLAIVVYNKGNTTSIGNAQGIRIQHQNAKNKINPSTYVNIVPGDEREAKLSNCQLWVDYVYLDTDERRRFAQKNHEYLIDQLQFTATEEIPFVNDVSNHTYNLGYNHPVKELIWVVRDENYRAVKGIGEKNGWFNFGYNTYSATPSGDASTDTYIAPTLYSADAPEGTRGTVANGRSSDWLANTYTTKFILNGHDRLAPRPSSYYRLVQPYQHHTKVPDGHVYNYSFSIKPEEHQPSGTLNFSRIDSSEMVYSIIGPPSAPTGKDGGMAGNNSLEVGLTLHVFARNYNVLRVTSGMGGLAFAN